MEAMVLSRIEQELELRHMTVKNRVARSAVHSFIGNPDGTLSEAELAMYEALARGGVGLIFTGHCSVSPRGMANETQTVAYDERCLAGFRRLKEIAAAHGVKAVAQISHAGPRALYIDDLAAPSARALKKERHARALTLEEIADIETQFIEAAARVQAAGLDGVQLHAAHSYLLSQFLDETFNWRDDVYGGSAENRFRIVRRIVEGIKARCGEAFPVFVKINNDTETNDARYEEDLVYMLRELAALGVEAVECSGCDFISQPKASRVYYLPRIARLRAAVDLPLLLVGGVRSLADMEQVLAAGVDMVSLGRPLICEPDLLQRLRAGQEAAQCASCNRCFVLPNVKPGIRCVLHRKRKPTQNAQA